MADSTRIERHLALIPVYVFLVFAWTNFASDHAPRGPADAHGHFKGHDFAHFYVLAQIAAERATTALYDPAAQAARLDQLASGFDLRYVPVHTPQLAIALAPLAWLPYSTALTAWRLLQALLYVASGLYLVRTVPPLRAYQGQAMVTLLAAPAFHSLIAAGQTSAIPLAAITVALAALRRHRPTAAGGALGLLALKPTLALCLPLVISVRPRARLLMGLLVSVVIPAAAAAAWFGAHVYVDYFGNIRTALASRPALEQNPWMLHSVWTVLAVPGAWRPLADLGALIASAAVLATTLRVWRLPAPIDLRFAAFLLALVLVDPHVYTYELVVATPALAIVAARALNGATPSVPRLALVASAYFLPAFDGLTRLTHIQWSVLAYAALFVRVTVDAHTAPETPDA